MPRVLRNDVPRGDVAVGGTPFSRGLDLLKLLLSDLKRRFVSCCQGGTTRRTFFRRLKFLQDSLGRKLKDKGRVLRERVSSCSAVVARQGGTNVVSERRRGTVYTTLRTLGSYLVTLTIRKANSTGKSFLYIGGLFSRERRVHRGRVSSTNHRLARTFRFLTQMFKRKRRVMVFLSRLSTNCCDLGFIDRYNGSTCCGCGGLLLLGRHARRLGSRTVRLLKL